MTDLDKLAAQRELGERIGVFAEAMHAPETPALRELERQALEEGVPIIRPHTRGLIQCILEMTAPERILEIGTAVGYSALVMHTYAPQPCKILTIEKDPARAAQARDNFARFNADHARDNSARFNADHARDNFARFDSDHAEGITLMEGDAAQILQELEGTFDFIFLDAAKGQYIRYLPDIIRLLPPGGVLLTDNVLKEGEILESKFVVERRDRTIHKRMREYLTAISRDPRLRTVLMETGDGAALSVKRRSADGE